VSALGFSGIISLEQYIFISRYVFTAKIVPQVWRVFTAFLITKPKFGILLDPYFLYQYGSGLERESSRFAQPGDFFVYTMFVGSAIVVSLVLVRACCDAFASPWIICSPNLTQWLKRFLDPRESTPAYRASRHSQNIKGICAVCGHGGIAT
jgi:membrane associated rhomboid family serine protease